MKSLEVSGSAPSPDVGGRSPGVSRVGCVLLPEGEESRFLLGWAAMLWSVAGRGPRAPPSLALLVCSLWLPLGAPVVARAQEK